MRPKKTPKDQQDHELPVVQERDRIRQPPAIVIVPSQWSVVQPSLVRPARQATTLLP